MDQLISRFIEQRLGDSRDESSMQRRQSDFKRNIHFNFGKIEHIR